MGHTEETSLPVFSFEGWGRDSYFELQHSVLTIATFLSFVRFFSI